MSLLTPFTIPETWLWFTVAFGGMLFATFIMSGQSRHLLIMDQVERRFSMINLEFPGTPKALVDIISHIFKLDNDKKNKTIKALKGQLLIDFFFFMPSCYGGIFLLSMKIATKMSSYTGRGFFTIFAWLQALAFLLDIIENIYIWRKIKPTLLPPGLTEYRAFQCLELIKWGIPLLAFVSGFSSLLYFWITGQYSIQSYVYIGLIAAEIILFIVAGIIRSGKTASGKNSLAEKN